MENKRYFDIPTQVVFYDVDGDEWKFGIAWGENIICACCGGVIEIAEVYEYAPAEIVKPICAYAEWCDITDDIIGGEMPEEWVETYDPLPDDEAEEIQAEAWYFANLQDKVD